MLRILLNIFASVRPLRCASLGRVYAPVLDTPHYPPRTSSVVRPCLRSGAPCSVVPLLRCSSQIENIKQLRNYNLSFYAIYSSAPTENSSVACALRSSMLLTPPLLKSRVVRARLRSGAPCSVAIFFRCSSYKHRPALD